VHIVLVLVVTTPNSGFQVSASRNNSVEVYVVQLYWSQCIKNDLVLMGDGNCTVQ